MDQGVECLQLGKFDPLHWPSDCLAFFQPREAGHISPRKLIEAQQKLAYLNNCSILDNAIVTKIEKSNQEEQSVDFSFFIISSTYISIMISLTYLPLLDHSSEQVLKFLTKQSKLSCFCKVRVHSDFQNFENCKKYV